MAPNEKGNHQESLDGSVQHYDIFKLNLIQLLKQPIYSKYWGQMKLLKKIKIQKNTVKMQSAKCRTKSYEKNNLVS